MHLLLQALLGLVASAGAAASGGACESRPFSASADSVTTLAIGRSSSWLRLNDDDSASAATLAFASSCGAEDELSLELWAGKSCDRLTWRATVRLECERWSGLSSLSHPDSSEGLYFRAVGASQEACARGSGE